MDKIQKKEFVKKTTETLNDIGLLVITHYSGLKTSETDELRLKLRETGGAFQITKNSLMQLVLKENKNKELKDLFKGPIAIAYSKDPFIPSLDDLIKFGSMYPAFLKSVAITDKASLPDWLIAAFCDTDL